MPLSKTRNNSRNEHAKIQHEINTLALSALYKREREKEKRNKTRKQHALHIVPFSYRVRNASPLLLFFCVVKKHTNSKDISSLLHAAREKGKGEGNVSYEEGREVESGRECGRDSSSQAHTNACTA